MEIDLYHGSERIVRKPLYGYGKVHNDYGLGFYCTRDCDMAREWGSSRTSDGYVNCYSLEMEDLKVLDLNEKDYTVLHWLTILLENRSFEIPSALAFDAREYLLHKYRLDYENYDMLIGYRADDSYFSFAQDFLAGAISLRQLKNAMSLGNLGMQYVLKSEKAFDRIHFKRFETIDSKIWFRRREERDLAARRDYFDLERNRRVSGDLYIGQIIDEGL